MPTTPCHSGKTDRRSFLKKLAGMYAFTSVFSSVVCAQSQMSEPSQKIPKFHDHLPDGELPKVRDPSQYAGKPLVQRIYLLAGAIPKVLYVLPCYCACDRAEGHTCLLDCFVGEHGVWCTICQKEVVFAFRETRRGKSPEEIRALIISNEYRPETINDLRQLPTM
jgi:hypothetical protein